LPFVLDLTEPLPVNPRTHRMIVEMAPTPSMVRVPSEYMFLHLLERFHISSKRIRHIPPGVDMWTGVGAMGAERLQSMSRLWRLPEHATVALVPMPLERGMGHEIFLDAMASIKDENLYAVLVGSDRHAPGRRAEIEAEITRRGLNGKV